MQRTSPYSQMLRCGSEYCYEAFAQVWVAAGGVIDWSVWTGIGLKRKGGSEASQWKCSVGPKERGLQPSD